MEQLRSDAAELPTSPGVYLFKDERGVVLYVGKAKSLRNRVQSYLQPSARLAETRGPEIDRMVRELAVGIDYVECDSEVDALLHENRLVKDIQPRFNERLKDDKSFPYLQIVTSEDFPRVAITREPRSRGVKLYGPFVSPKDLREALPLMQRVFKFRTCNLDISADDESRGSFRPCILYNIRQCTAPCAAHVSKDDYSKQIRHLRQFLESKGTALRRELGARMREAAEAREFERAAAIRDELRALDGLQKRGLAGEDLQPEVFFADPTEGLTRLGEVLNTGRQVRTIEGVDIAHLAGKETCGAMVCFIDGKPFKNAYRRYRIKSHARNDDYASIREVVWRRYKLAGMHEELFPDVILIDGGPGQLSAAYSAFDGLETTPPMLISLAKKEEIVHVHGRAEPLKLSRHDAALKLLQAVRDEAHRFAQHYHHILRRRATLDSDRPVRRRRARGGADGNGDPPGDEA
jgi:excinuclease ABC subunit C